MGLALHAAGSVAFAAGVPAWLWQSGQFLAAITDTGVGDITVTFQADQGVDAAESVIICTPRGAVLQVTATVVHTTDVAKQILLATAAAAADDNFDIVVFKRKIA